MRRELSSSATKLWKFYFPVAWISFMGFGVLLNLTKLTAEPIVGFYVLAWVAASCWLFRFAQRLKRVALEDGYLYVSDYKKEIRLPLSSIEAVTENNPLEGPKQVTIRLRSPSEFGMKIVFIAKSGWFHTRFHPVVAELREIIREHSATFSASDPDAHGSHCFADVPVQVKEKSG